MKLSKTHQVVGGIGAATALVVAGMVIAGSGRPVPQQQPVIVVRDAGATSAFVSTPAPQPVATTAKAKPATVATATTTARKAPVQQMSAAEAPVDPGDSNPQASEPPPAQTSNSELIEQGPATTDPAGVIRAPLLPSLVQPTPPSIPNVIPPPSATPDSSPS